MNSAEETVADDVKMTPLEETTGDRSLFASATREELFVSQILLEFDTLIPLPRFIWGSRKMRSCLDTAPSAPPPSIQVAEEDIEVRRPLVKAEEAPTTSSPATPFSFSPSESDGKSKRCSKNISKKRSRAEFNHEIEELTKQGDLLRMEVEDARKEYEKLKAQNLDLKAMEQEALATRRIKEEPQRDKGKFLNLAVNFIDNDETIMVPPRQPLVADQTAHKLHHTYEPVRTQLDPTNNGFKPVNRVGRPGLLDLNIALDEGSGMDSTQPLDVNQEIAGKQARFAEARRLRKGIIKNKSMRSACRMNSTRT